eukprot:6174091-Pleurochrysis_carterae.AAC.2
MTGGCAAIASPVRLRSPPPDISTSRRTIGDCMDRCDASPPALVGLPCNQGMSPEEAPADGTTPLSPIHQEPRRSSRLASPAVENVVVHACASWQAGYACRPMEGHVQVRGRRPAEGAAPSRASVRGPRRGRAKACNSGMNINTKIHTRKHGKHANVQPRTKRAYETSGRKVHSKGTPGYVGY